MLIFAQTLKTVKWAGSNMTCLSLCQSVDMDYANKTAERRKIAHDNIVCNMLVDNQASDSIIPFCRFCLLDVQLSMLTNC